MIAKGVHIGGAIKSKKDYRAEIVKRALASLLANPTPALAQELYTKFYQQYGLVMMQGQTPSCVSHSIVYLMKLYWFLKTGKIIDFNPQYLHIKSAFQGAQPTDGRDPQTVLQMAQKWGCCTSATLPINVNVPLAQYCDPSVITPEMDAEAAQWKIPGFAPVTLTQEGIRQAIQTYGAVSILFQIGQEFWTNLAGQESWAQADIDPIRPPASVVGGHQLTGIGWNSDLEHLINEWSTQWAENGESDWIFAEWSTFILEAWVIADVPGPILATIQGLPAPKEFIHNFQTDLKQGETSEEVRALQIALSIAGFNTYPEITGFYGTLTAASVLAFQKAKNVAPISELESLNGGTVGPATRTALNVLFNT